MPLKFKKTLIADERYEAAGVFDINGDGILDIVSGAYWYEGPDFKKQHFIGDVMIAGDYFDDFFNIPMDINGNGRLDYLTGGWFGCQLRWVENPGNSEEKWKTHIIADTGNIETAYGWDVDGDGMIEVVPNLPGKPLTVFKLITDSAGKGTGEFKAHTIWDQPQGHGLGFGDITGNGRGDFVMSGGWLEAPADPYQGEWKFHPDFNLGSASVPILVVDVNADGLNDLIVGQAHGYGLDWYEQRRNAKGEITWKKHIIDPDNSQYHYLIWADIDGDGKSELITGKRYRAHGYADPGSLDPLGIYYFKWTGEAFVKQVIDYGPIRQGNGCGIYFQAVDLRGTGRLDIVAPGKDGLFVYYNEGY